MRDKGTILSCWAGRSELQPIQERQAGKDTSGAFGDGARESDVVVQC